MEGAPSRVCRSHPPWTLLLLEVGLRGGWVVVGGRPGSKEEKLERPPLLKELKNQQGN